MSERDTPQQAPRLPSRWAVARDILTFFGGWAVIFLEVLRPEVRESVLILGGTAIGIPGLAVGFTSVLEAVTARRNGTDVSPSQPQAQAGSPSS